MVCTALVPAREFRIDPALTPALFASVGTLPTTGEWYAVNSDDHILCCILTALAAQSSDLPTACSAADDIGDYELPEFRRFREKTGLPFSAPYLIGLLDGWDTNDEAHRASMIDRLNNPDLDAYRHGRADGYTAIKAVNAVQDEPSFPLADAHEFDIRAKGDDDEDEDEDDAEEFDDEWEDSEGDDEDDDEDKDDDWDEEDDV